MVAGALTGALFKSTGECLFMCQIAERKDQAIDSKSGEAKAECVDYKHLRNMRADRWGIG